MNSIELDYDIEELRDCIQGMSYEEKLDVISGKETFILSMVEEFEGYLSEISQLKEEIEDGQRSVFCTFLKNYEYFCGANGRRSYYQDYHILPLRKKD